MREGFCLTVSLNENILKKTGYIPDGLYFPLGTINEMKKFYSRMYPEFSEEKFNKLGELFEFDTKKPIRTFSKGQTKQIAFWLILSCSPEYLILDEPMDGLDPIMRHKIRSVLMREVEMRKLTILVSSHNLRELEDICDMVAIMDKGSVILERSLESLQENITKLQVVFPKGKETVISSVSALHISNLGRVYTIITRMPPDEALEMINKYEPVLADALPLTLEEIFIYELGGEGSAVSKIFE